MTVPEVLEADWIMRVHWGRKDKARGAPESRDDGWDLFGTHSLSSLDGLGGVEGDGSDARSLPDVDYTHAVRRAKRGVGVVQDNMMRWQMIDRVETRASSTPEGKPVFTISGIALAEPGEGWTPPPFPPPGYELATRFVEDKSGHWREEARLYWLGPRFFEWRFTVRVRSWFPKSAGTEYLAWYQGMLARCRDSECQGRCGQPYTVPERNAPAPKQPKP